MKASTTARTRMSRPVARVSHAKSKAHSWLLRTRYEATATRLTRPKPFVRVDQFYALLQLIAEPYASMVYVAVFTAMRVSELAGLMWRNVHADSITIEQRFSRGDWDEPKSEASRATIAVDEHVIERIHGLKSIEVVVRAGRAKRRYKAVKSDAPDALVFQSVKTGALMRDNSILSRHIKPAARQLGIGWVNWQVLRRSCATWLDQAHVSVKDAQGLMRHSRASTTQDVYQQVVPEAQRRDRTEADRVRQTISEGSGDGAIAVTQVQPNAIKLG